MVADIFRGPWVLAWRCGKRRAISAEPVSKFMSAIETLAVRAALAGIFGAARALTVAH